MSSLFYLYFRRGDFWKNKKGLSFLLLNPYKFDFPPSLPPKQNYYLHW